METYIGKVVGYLKVINWLPGEGYLCKCSCGKEFVVSRLALKCGIKSCETCKNRRKRKNLESKKGPLYHTWRAIKERCFGKGGTVKNYGARGITMCERWRRSFEAFADDMGPKPKGYTIERMDNDKGYFPENCRWATQKEQMRNTRKTVKMLHKGELKPLVLAAEEEDISGKLLYSRVKHNCPEEKLFQPPKQRGEWPKPHKPYRPRVLPKPKRAPRKPIRHNGITASIREWSEMTGLSYATIVRRLNGGWSVKNTLTVPSGWKSKYVVFRVGNEDVFVLNEKVSEFIEECPGAEVVNFLS